MAYHPQILGLNETKIELWAYGGHDQPVNLCDHIFQFLSDRFGGARGALGFCMILPPHQEPNQAEVTNTPQLPKE